MKLKSLLFMVGLGLFTNLFAANVHLNPQATAKDKTAIAKNVAYPGFCEIEIINESYTNVRVFGTFDDGATTVFDIYSYESPHYINLFYSWYCHSGMYITIVSPYNTIYSGWTDVNSTIRVVPYYGATGKDKQQLKAVVTSK